MPAQRQLPCRGGPMAPPQITAKVAGECRDIGSSPARLYLPGAAGSAGLRQVLRVDLGCRHRFTGQLPAIENLLVGEVLDVWLIASAKALTRPLSFFGQHRALALQRITGSGERADDLSDRWSRGTTRPRLGPPCWASVSATSPLISTSMVSGRSRRNCHYRARPANASAGQSGADDRPGAGAETTGSVGDAHEVDLASPYQEHSAGGHEVSVRAGPPGTRLRVPGPTA